LLIFISSSGFVSVVKYLIKKSAAAANISIKAKKIIFMVFLLLCYRELLSLSVINKKKESDSSLEVITDVR